MSGDPKCAEAWHDGYITGRRSVLPDDADAVAATVMFLADDWERDGVAPRALRRAAAILQLVVDR